MGTASATALNIFLLRKNIATESNQEYWISSGQCVTAEALPGPRKHRRWTLREKYPNTEFFLVRIFLYSD